MKSTNMRWTADSSNVRRTALARKWFFCLLLACVAPLQSRQAPPVLPDYGDVGSFCFVLFDEKATSKDGLGDSLGNVQSLIPQLTFDFTESFYSDFRRGIMGWTDVTDSVRRRCAEAYGNYDSRIRVMYPRNAGLSIKSVEFRFTCKQYSFAEVSDGGRIYTVRFNQSITDKLSALAKRLRAKMCICN